jgi:hypothetical protein
MLCTMRTTLTLDQDVAALVERERRRTGETMREAVNRLIRRGLQRGPRGTRRAELPTLPGRPRVDVADVSKVLADADDEHVRGKGLL